MSLDEALGIFGEAAQDMSSAGLALAAGNLYNCADLCNQVAEKSLQAVYVLVHDNRATYAHDLPALGKLAGAPPNIIAELEVISPYHPAHFLEGRTVEEADDAVSGETAQDLLQRTRTVLRWARQIVLTAE